MIIRCNNCYSIYCSESDLEKVLISDTQREVYNGQQIDEKNQEIINGCKECLTDEYLTDIL